MANLLPLIKEIDALKSQLTKWQNVLESSKDLGAKAIGLEIKHYVESHFPYYGLGKHMNKN